MKIILKRISHRLRLIYKNPSDRKFLKMAPTKIQENGIIVLVHESEKLGASILALNIVKELKKENIPVYVISRQFGPLNKEFNNYAPTQVILSKGNFQNTIRKLHENYGYSKMIANTAVVGDYIKIAKKENYQVISLIHELSYVIENLGLVSRTRNMINYSDKVVFSTTIAKSEVLKLCDIKDNSNIEIRPQGTYFKIPEKYIIEKNIKKLENKYPKIIGRDIVIGVGNTSYRKGFDTFIEISEKMQNVIFMWAGKKENFYNKVYKNWNSKFPSNFIFLDQLGIEELAALYQKASLLLMCSRKDTLPSTIFESLLFDTPVIGSSTSGGIVDLIDAKNGYLINDYEVDNFVKAVAHCLDKNNYSILISNIEHEDKNLNSFDKYVKYLEGLFI